MQCLNMKGLRSPATSAGRSIDSVRCQVNSFRPQAVPRGEGQIAEVELTVSSRRDLLAKIALASTVLVSSADVLPVQAASMSPLEYKKELARRRKKIPEEDFLEGPEGVKYYDIIPGDGTECKVGDRIAVHYDVKFRNVTFVTSRQGMGVTGGTPVGFNVGTESGEAGSTLPGIDFGVRGMRVGGLRRLIVPPELAYGSRGVGEIPPNATLTVDVELLSIKQNAFGSRVKLVEG